MMVVFSVKRKKKNYDGSVIFFEDAFSLQAPPVFLDLRLSLFCCSLFILSKLADHLAIVNPVMEVRIIQDFSLVF